MSRQAKANRQEFLDADRPTARPLADFPVQEPGGRLPGGACEWRAHLLFCHIPHLPPLRPPESFLNFAAPDIHPKPRSHAAAGLCFPEERFLEETTASALCAASPAHQPTLPGNSRPLG